MNTVSLFTNPRTVAIRRDMRALVLERNDNRDREPQYMVVYSCSGAWVQPHIWTSRVTRDEALRQLESDKLNRMLRAPAVHTRHAADARPYLGGAR